MEKATAKFFYEQMAGAYDGHMACVPHNPVLFSLVAAHAGNRNGPYACTQDDFANILRGVADALTEDKD